MHLIMERSSIIPVNSDLQGYILCNITEDHAFVSLQVNLISKLQVVLDVI